MADAPVIRTRPKRHVGGKPFVKGDPRIARDKQFKPGQPSANPGGRPSDKDFREMCRRLAMDEAPYLDSRFRDGQVTTAQVRAFEAVADRGGWSPPRRLELSGPDGAPVPIEQNTVDLSLLSDEQLRQYRALLQAAKRRDG